jgi:hypothetical protein
MIEALFVCHTAGFIIHPCPPQYQPQNPMSLPPVPNLSLARASDFERLGRLAAELNRVRWPYRGPTSAAEGVRCDDRESVAWSRTSG